VPPCRTCNCRSSRPIWPRCLRGPSRAFSLRASGFRDLGDSLDDLIRGLDVHLGTPEEVAESLSADRTIDHATDVAIQVHSVDPPHPLILRSAELFATRVAPALGWTAPPTLALAAAS
jgi:hypothetical protein